MVSNMAHTFIPKKRNILIISSRIPYPLTAGFRIRIYNVAKYFKNDGNAVDLLYMGSKAEYEKYKIDLHQVFRNVYFVPFSKLKALFHLGRCICSFHLPLQVQLYQSNAFKKKLLEIEGQYDLIIGNHIRTAEYLKLLNPKKVILDMHDAISYNYANAVKVTKGIKRIIYRMELPRVLDYECKIISDFPRVVMISDNDRIWLKKHGADTSHITVIPVSVRDDIQDFKIDYTKDENAICFLGKMSYQPNIDAVLWFSKYVFPQLLKQHGDLIFYIMGIEPTPEVVALQKNPYIKVTGFMDDPYEVMAKVKATVVPILNGAGVQNKVLESMVIGTPVVASTIAADGIQAEDNKQLLIASNQDEFVQKVDSLLISSDLRAQIGKSGKKYIESHFTWDALWKSWKKLADN